MAINNGADPVLTLPEDNTIGWGGLIRAAFSLLNISKANVGHTHPDLAIADHEHLLVPVHSHSEIPALTTRIQAVEDRITTLDAIDGRVGSLSRYVTTTNASNHSHSGTYALQSHGHSEFSMIGNSYEIAQLAARIDTLETLIKPPITGTSLTIGVNSDLANKIILLITLSLSQTVKTDYYRIEIYDANNKLFYKAESKENVFKLISEDLAGVMDRLAITGKGGTTPATITIHAFAKTFNGETITATPTPYTFS